MNRKQCAFSCQGTGKQVFNKVIAFNVVVNIAIFCNIILDECIVSLFVTTTHLYGSDIKSKCAFADHACVNFIHKFRTD